LNLTTTLPGKIIQPPHRQESQTSQNTSVCRRSWCQ